MKYTPEQLFEGCTRPPKGCIVLEPFANTGEIMNWIGTENIIIPYDSEPKIPKVIRRNTLLEKPKYYGTYVVTQAPNQKKSEAEDKTIFDMYGTDNLYKCFIKTILTEQPQGGIIILPIKFLSGMRDSEVKRRVDFFKIFKPIRFNVFDMESVVVNFTKRTYDQPFVKEIWNFNFYPKNTSINIDVANSTRPIQTYLPIRKGISCGFTPKKGWTKTNLVLVPNDYENKKMGLYQTDEETVNTLYIKGVLSNKLYKQLSEDFNKYVQNQREADINIVVPFSFIDDLAAKDIIESWIWNRFLT